VNLAAIILASAAAPAQQPAPPQNSSVIVQAPRILPSVGLMNDHMHEAGQLMIGIRYQHFGWSGANRHGTDSVSDGDLLAGGYMMRAKSMAMDMVMLDLMYGITEKLTVTLSPQYVWNRMTMVGIDPMGGMDGGMTLGEVGKESFHGFGDTLASASLRLARNDRFNAHVTLGLWVPTGKANLKSPDGIFTEYDMQTGSGTWDVQPSATITGRSGLIGWGAQASYIWRAERRNHAGYRLGNKAQLTGWASYLLRPQLGITARAEFTQQGRIHHQYDGPQSDAMPEDLPENYGGELVIGAFGLNFEPGMGRMRGPQLGVELGIPLYQRVNGIQLPQKWQLSAGVRQFF